MSGHLGVILSKMRDSPRAAQLSLREELAVARVAALRALALATPALEGDVTSPPLVALSLGVLREAMAYVRDLVVAADKIERESDGRVSGAVVRLILNQVTSAVTKILAEDPESMRAVLAEIERRVKCTDSTPPT